jgi:hypothetical protein
MSIDVLKGLFEQRFHAPPERVQPLQGQFGGSGRVIVRLAAGEQSAIGILYDVREENAVLLNFWHSRRHGLPVPEIYADDLRRRHLSKTSATRRRLSSWQQIAPEKILRQRRMPIRRWWRCCRAFR